DRIGECPDIVQSLQIVLWQSQERRKDAPRLPVLEVLLYRTYPSTSSGQKMEDAVGQNLQPEKTVASSSATCSVPAQPSALPGHHRKPHRVHRAIPRQALLPASMQNPRSGSQKAPLR